MDNSSGNITRLKVYVRTALDSGSTIGYSFVNENTTPFSLQGFPANDFYIPVFLTDTVTIDGYVQVDKDNTIYAMQRQDINPYFIEFGFFDTIQRNEVNQGSDLTIIMLNYIRSVRPDVAALNDTDLRAAYDSTLRYQFPWPGNITVANLETISLVAQDVISKAKFFSIDVNS